MLERPLGLETGVISGPQRADQDSDQGPRLIMEELAVVRACIDYRMSTARHAFRKQDTASCLCNALSLAVHQLSSVQSIESSRTVLTLQASHARVILDTRRPECGAMRGRLALLSSIDPTSPLASDMMVPSCKQLTFAKGNVMHTLLFTLEGVKWGRRGLPGRRIATKPYWLC